MSPPLPALAQQGIPGGDASVYRTEANAYRAFVRSRVQIILAELADRWDGDKPAEVARMYSSNGTIVLGPDRSIQGRDAIRKAFAENLNQMRGVLFAMDEYDLSGELAYVRVTMKYELIHGDGRRSMETAIFTMALRPRWDDWLIESHTIAGVAALPQPAAVAGSADGRNLISPGR